MSGLRELDDKRPLVEALREVAGRHIAGLVVSMPPPPGEQALLSDTHPCLRVIMCLSGEYRFGYYDHGVREDVVLPLDRLLVTLPGGYLTSVCDRAHRSVQIIFWDKFIRYLLAEDAESKWFHTANPLSAHGQHLLRGFCAMPFDKEFDGVRTQLAEALARLALIELERDDSRRKGKAFGTYHAALEFMRGNLHRQLGRSAVARASGVTESHLSKLFRRFESREFNQVLKAVRCERAAALLRNDNLTVDEIASLCGFKTSAHFIRVFKMIMGTTPGAFKNAAGGDQPRASRGKLTV